MFNFFNSNSLLLLHKGFDLMLKKVLLNSIPILYPYVFTIEDLIYSKFNFSDFVLQLWQVPVFHIISVKGSKVEYTSQICSFTFFEIFIEVLKWFYEKFIKYIDGTQCQIRNKREKSTVTFETDHSYTHLTQLLVFNFLTGIFFLIRKISFKFTIFKLRFQF